jgi:FkbM family methyltransferase
VFGKNGGYNQFFGPVSLIGLVRLTFKNSGNARPMRPIDRIRALHRIVGATRKTVVVDVGANPFNGVPVYALLRRSGVARIIGFEPQPEALEALRSAARPDETYLPYAIGEGREETLHITKNSGLVSILEPDPWVADYLNPWWRRAIEVRERVPMMTRRLDDVEEIDQIDFLKIDIQGGELAVFQNARSKLASASLIQTEVPIIRYYRGQPTLGEVQAELEAQGFIAHKFVEMSAHHVDYPSAMAEGLPIKKSQATVADMAFLRSPAILPEMSVETLQHMTVLADSVLQSFDLVFRCLGELVRRNITKADEVKEYVALLKGTAFSK